MSRDRRQRENRRRSRRAADDGTARGDDHLVRTNVPGALQHASSDVDEFDAAIVRGAGGVPAPIEDESVVAQPSDAPPLERDDPLDQPSLERDDRLDEPPLEGNGGSQPPGGSGGRRGDGGGRGNGGGSGPFGRGEEEPSSGGLPAPRQPARAPKRPLPARAAAFTRASWAELQRVQWPDRREVWQATAVVLGFVAVAGIYLGVADWVAEHIIKAIL